MFILNEEKDIFYFIFVEGTIETKNKDKIKCDDEMVGQLRMVKAILTFFVAYVLVLMSQ